MNRIKSKLKKYTASDYFIVLLFDVFAKILMVAATIFIIRILTTKEYAIYIKFQSISSIMFSILGGGLAIAFVRFATEKISRGNHNIYGLFISCNLLIVGLTILLFSLFPLLNNVYGVATYTSCLALAYGGLLSLNKMNESYFQTKEQFRKSGVASNIKNVTLCISVVFVYLALRSISAEHIMLVTLFSSLVAFGIGFIWIRKNSSAHKSESEMSQGILFELIRESGWLIVYFVLVSLFDQGCIIIMSNIASDMDVAVYGVAAKYYMLMLTFLTSISTVLRIKTSKKEIVDDPNARIEFTKNWIKKVWKLAAGVCLLAILSAKFIFPILNGPDYNAAIPVFKILTVGVFISYIFAPNVSVMMAAKLHKLLCVLALISFGINCIICYALIPIWGAKAAAIAVVMSNAVLNGSSTFIILKSKHKPVSLK